MWAPWWLPERFECGSAGFSLLHLQFVKGRCSDILHFGKYVRWVMTLGDDGRRMRYCGSWAYKHILLSKTLDHTHSANYADVRQGSRTLSQYNSSHRCTERNEDLTTSFLSLFTYSTLPAVKNPTHTPNKCYIGYYYGRSAPPERGAKVSVLSYRSGGNTSSALSLTSVGTKCAALERSSTYVVNWSVCLLSL